MSGWLSARNLLAVRLDNAGDVIMLGPALRAVKAALPQAHLTLMCSPAGSQAAALLPWVDEIFVWRAVWQDVSASLDHDPQRELELVEALRIGQYDAALIFTSFTQSPHPPAYICSGSPRNQAPHPGSRHLSGRCKRPHWENIALRTANSDNQ